MYAMQYEIALPADYDMDIIRERVRTTGHLMDGFPGLEFKAFLIREKAKGASENSYAPFYVWRDTKGMSSFCWGEPGYSSIVRDFGRHPIHDWTLHEIAYGPAGYAKARSLSIQKISLPAGATPSSHVERLSTAFLSDTNVDTIARVTAVDVCTWTLILVELSAKAANQTAVNSADAGTTATHSLPGDEITMKDIALDRVTYEVLHVSTAR